MKSIDINNLDSLPGQKLEKDDTFSFQCHSGLACFNQCCRNLNLFLYPYDVIRLKKRLSMTSDRFIDKYADLVLRPSDFFPEVLLKMSDNKEKTCPFLTGSGCGIYTDRPDTCRTFPVEQGIVYDAGKKKTDLIYFFRPPDFCLGKGQNTTWTPKTWATDQDAVIYNKMTMLWAELKRMFVDPLADPWGGQGADGPKGKMAFMATYNTDMFRDFLFNSSFLKRYRVKSKILKKIRSDDVLLMKFGFEWVRFYLWGIKSNLIMLK